MAVDVVRVQVVGGVGTLDGLRCFDRAQAQQLTRQESIEGIGVLRVSAQLLRQRLHHLRPGLGVTMSELAKPVGKTDAGVLGELIVGGGFGQRRH